MMVVSVVGHQQILEEQVNMVNYREEYVRDFIKIVLFDSSMHNVYRNDHSLRKSCGCSKPGKANTPSTKHLLYHRFQTYAEEDRSH
jgi:hypothetical protein